MFDCPACRARLVCARTRQGMHWTCPACRGRMVGLPVLRRSVAKAVVNRLWQSVCETRPDGPRPCASCGRAMAQLPVRGSEDASPAPPPPDERDDAVIVDVCRPCGLIWFDPLEMEALPAAARPVPTKPELSLEAREALGRLRLEQLRRREQDRDGDGPQTWTQGLLAAIGLPVEQDADPTLRRPWATWATAGLIALIGGLAILAAPEVIDRYGLRPSAMWRDGGLTLVTSFFLHSGWFHLLGNIYFLLLAGDNVEDCIGPARWAVLLAVSVLAGDLAHAALDPRADVPVVGASGGISGLLAFYALQFPRNRIGLMIGSHLARRWVSMPAAAWFGVWVAFQLAWAMLQHSGFGSVSALAHLGGAAVGAAFWLLWRPRG